MKIQTSRQFLAKLAARRRSRAAHLMPLAATVFISATPLLAADGTWTGIGGDNNWRTTTNWNPIGTPGSTTAGSFASTESATFSTAGSGTINLGDFINIKNINFGVGMGNAGAFVIGDGNDTLNLSNNGAITMGSGVTTNEQIGSLGTIINLSSSANSAYSFINNSATAGAQLNIVGNVVGNTTATASTLTLAGTNGGTVSGVISNGTAGGTVALTKAGAGTWALTNANTYTGATTASNGTLKLDFSATGAPTGATGIVAAGSALKLGGGTVQIVGAAAGSTQTLASTSSTAATGGMSVIAAAPVSGGVNPTVNLGTLTGTQGALVRFDGAAYNSGASSGTTTGGTTVAATATFNTTTNAVNSGLIANSAAVNSTSGGAGAYATVGLYDWAAISTGTNGTAQAGTIVGGSQVSGFYLTTGTLTAGALSPNLDLTASGTMGANSTSTSSAYATVRFNTASALTLTTGRALSENVVGGILVTPNVGANNTTIAQQGGANLMAFQASRTASGATGLTVWQNNTAGELLINAQYANGSNSAATASYTQGGPGTVVMGQANGYTGQTYLDGGTTVITTDGNIGAVATAAAANLNGGTLFGNATFALDNAGANPRPVTLNGVGGTLAASATNTFTISGVISGAGDLRIGTGTIAGTGAGTANTTAVIGNGIVRLTGVNTYTGATAINSGSTLSMASGSSIATSSSLALNSGTFIGTGTVGATTVANSAANSLQNLGGTVLTLSSLTFNGAASITDTLAAAPGIAVTGALTTTGANGQVTIGGSNTVWSNGLNNLITYGSFGGSIGDFTKGTFTGFSGRQTAGALALNGNAIALNVIGDTTVYSGANGGQWVQYAQNTPTSATPNFSLKANHTPTDFWVADSVEFNDTYNVGAGDVAVTQTTATIHGGNVSPTTLTFNNSAVNYTITSDDGSGIASGLVIKNGTGTAALNTSNSYTGGTTINAGTLAINSATSLGAASGGLTINAGTLETTADITTARNIALGAATSTVLTDPGTTYTVSGVVSGTGALNKTGTGTLNLAGANSFTGDLNINVGMLVANLANNTTNPASSALGNPQIAGRNINVNTGTTLQFASGDTLGGAGSTILTPIVVTGGTVTNNGLSYNTLGPISLNGGTLTGTGGSSNGSFQMYGFGGAVTVGGAAGSTISGAGTTGGGSAASTVGYHLGTAVATGTTFNVADVTGNAAADLNVSGTLIDRTGGAGAASLTKTGAGTMALSAANTYTGGTAISAGVLRLDNTLAVQNSTVTVNVDNGLGFGTGITTATLGALAGANAVALTNSDSNAVALTAGGNNASTTYAGVLSGTGSSLTKNGTGTLTLTGASIYTGGTTVNGGTFALGNNGSVSGAIGLANGTTFNMAATTSIFPSNAIQVAAGGTAAFNSALITNGYSGAISSGDSSSVLNIGTNVSFSNATSQQFSGFIGTVNVNGSLRFSSTSLANNGGLGTTFNIASGATLNTRNALTSGGSVFLGALTGTGTLNGETTTGGNNLVTYSIGALGSNTTFGGVIGNGSGTTAIVKTGTGSLALTGATTYTGATTVNGGTLAVDNNGTTTAGRITGSTAANSIQANGGGTLLLRGGGTGDRVGNTAGTTLNSGTLAIAGTSGEGTAAVVLGNTVTPAGTTSAMGLGALSLTATTSTLDFDTASNGNVLVLTSFAVATGSILNITGYTNLTFDGTANSGGAGDDRLVFNQALSAQQLLDINFGAGLRATQLQLDTGFYEIGVGMTAVPEPATVLGGALLFGLALYRGRRRAGALLGLLSAAGRQP